MHRNFSSLSGQQFDLLICGGGIYGAWAAFDASLRGLKVALVEQKDWACATSSASTKLVHGGLRYLETLDLHLVKRALNERQRLLNLAPHRVWPIRFGIPIYQDGRFSKLKINLGLKLYDTLAGVGGSALAHSHTAPSELLDHYPKLQTKGLLDGFTYFDAQTDDARLTLELVAGAQAAGAVCVNYCQLFELIEQNGVATSALLRDQIAGRELRIRFSQMVSTIGQWFARCDVGMGQCRLSKGIHLVLPGGLLNEALLLTARSDGRVFFVVPWYGQTLLGTTDRDFHDDVNNVTVEPDDVDYLLNEANFYLGQCWSKQDILGCYAGLRVFKNASHFAPSLASREWEYRIAENGVIYSVGGKLTSARSDAGQMVDEVCRRLGNKTACQTEQHLLPWTPNTEFARWQQIVLNQAQQLQIDQESALYLLRRHGKHVYAVLEMVQQDPSLAQRIVDTVPLIYADLDFCARHEMVVHLDDLLRRRLPLLILARLDQHLIRKIAERVSFLLGWTEAEMLLEIDACRALQACYI